MSFVECRDFLVEAHGEIKVQRRKVFERGKLRLQLKECVEEERLLSKMTSRKMVEIETKRIFKREETRRNMSLGRIY